MRWNKRVRRAAAKTQEGVNKNYHGINLTNSYGDVMAPDVPTPFADSVYVVSFNLDTLTTFAPAAEACTAQVNDAECPDSKSSRLSSMPATSGMVRWPVHLSDRRPRHS